MSSKVLLLGRVGAASVQNVKPTTGKTLWGALIGTLINYIKIFNINTVNYNTKILVRLTVHRFLWPTNKQDGLVK
jgi:hypothetical protein